MGESEVENDNSEIVVTSEIGVSPTPGIDLLTSEVNSNDMGRFFRLSCLFIALLTLVALLSMSGSKCAMPNLNNAKMI